MLTDSDTKNKKQLGILLVIFIAASLIIPMLYSAYTDYTYNQSLATNIMPNMHIMSIFMYVSFICSALGNAALLYAAMRYRFKYCMLFFISTAVLTLIYDVFYIINLNTNNAAAFHTLLNTYIFDTITYTLLYFVSIIASLAVIRFVTNTAKKEWLAVIISLVAMLLISLLTDVINTAITFVSFNTLLQHIKNINIPSLLLSKLLTAVIYYLFWFLFVNNKKARLKDFASSSKRLASNLWNSTSK